MSTTASIKNYVNFTGDLDQEVILDSGSLTDSVAIQNLISLDSGNNEITVPDVEDYTVHGVVIVPPALNEVEPVIKGVAGDTGITLSATQASVWQFGATPPASIVISVAEAVAGFRLIWF